MPLDQFPPALRAMVEAELAAGNEIDEICGGFPAPPIGENIKFKKMITTSAPAGVTYRERNSSLSAGEYTDADRRFFLLNPAGPPPPEPDMDAIREAANTPRPRPEPEPTTALGRFELSMQIDYEKLREGIGYDMDVLKDATPADRRAIEELVLSRPVDDWRDVEALAAINTEPARAALRQALLRGSIRVRVTVLTAAPDLVTEEVRIRVLTEAIKYGDFYEGLTQAMMLVEEYHPRPIVDALLDGALNRKGEVATHFAAMLMYIHGKADSSFDWDQRPFFLRFNDPAEDRRKVFQELCEKIGVDPKQYTV